VTNKIGSHSLSLPTLITQPLFSVKRNGLLESSSGPFVNNNGTIAEKETSKQLKQLRSRISHPNQHSMLLSTNTTVAPNPNQQIGATSRTREAQPPSPLSQHNPPATQQQPLPQLLPPTLPPQMGSRCTPCPSTSLPRPRGEPACSNHSGHTCPTQQRQQCTPAGGDTMNYAFLTTETFNCHGVLQSHDYVLTLLQTCDILCLTETWLRPCELSIIDDVLNKSSLSDTFYVFSKSSMTDTDVSYTGRPFGGIAIICKKSAVFKYHMIDIHSDRIMCVSVNNNEGEPVHFLFNVYLPFYNAQCAQTELYTEVMDLLQSSIDMHACIAPIQILGDYNTQLPSFDVSKNSTWFKSNGFNRHSLIMYDFLLANELSVADHCFEQKNKFTYFCYKRNVFTWIDHTAV
jgi:hypothetical protein